MKYYTNLIKIGREGKQLYGYSEDFPGVYGLGKSIEEAKGRSFEALRIYIRESRARRRALPRSRTIYAETISITV